MNQVLIDNTLIALSLLAAALITKFLKRRKAGVFFSFFLLFPTLLIFLNMWAHTVAVSIVNYNRYQAGTFQYNFLLYSNLFFGLVFIIVSGINLHCSRKYIEGNLQQKRFILLLNIITALLFLPVGFINPIGFLPVIASVFSSIVLLAFKPFKPGLRYILTGSEPIKNKESELIH
jgi:hypothetical protein